MRYTVDLLRAGEQAEGWHALHALHALEVFAGSDGRDWNRHRSIMELARTGT